MLTRPLKVAIIHDWLVTQRGGEKVLEAIAEIYPQATIFTLFHEPGSVSAALERHTIRTSFLNRLPGARRFHRHFLPLMPLAIESFDLSGFDLILSSSHCVAKGVIPPPQAVHVCYSHTPMRYAWDRRADYFRSPFQHLISRPILHYLRMWDVTASNRVDSFIANSAWVAARIQRYYRRDAEVIFPFVESKLFEAPLRPREDFYLVASGFAPYKRIDLAIETCRQRKRRLVVVGHGQEAKRLQRLAGQGPHIEFRGQVSDPELHQLYATAQAFLFPGEEDFGIAPVEAMAMGCPVIAYGRGGATETVLNGRTGLFFGEQTVTALGEALEEFERRRAQFRPELCRQRAMEFSKARFQQSLHTHVEKALLKGVSRSAIPFVEPSFPSVN